MMSAPRTPFNTLPAPTQAGILCNDPRFQQFVGTRTIKSGVTVSASCCAEYIRTICKVPSRAHLRTNQTAAAEFQKLRTEFDAWTGKIAHPNGR